MNIVEVRLKNKFQITPQPLNFHFKPGSGRFKKCNYIQDKQNFDLIKKALQHLFYDSFHEDIEWSSLRFIDDAGHLWFVLKHRYDFYLEKNKKKVEGEDKKNALEKFFSYTYSTSSYKEKPFLDSKITLTDRDQLILISDQDEALHHENHKIEQQIQDLLNRHPIFSQGKIIEEHSLLQLCSELLPIFHELHFINKDLQKNESPSSKDIVKPWAERDQLTKELELLGKAEALLSELKDGELILQKTNEDMNWLESAMRTVFEKYDLKEEDFEKFLENIKFDELTHIHLSCIKIKKYEDVFQELEFIFSTKIESFEKEWQNTSKIHLEKMSKNIENMHKLFQRNKETQEAFFGFLKQMLQSSRKYLFFSKKNIGVHLEQISRLNIDLEEQTKNVLQNLEEIENISSRTQKHSQATQQNFCQIKDALSREKAHYSEEKSLFQEKLAAYGHSFYNTTYDSLDKFQEFLSDIFFLRSSFPEHRYLKQRQKRMLEDFSELELVITQWVEITSSQRIVDLSQVKTILNEAKKLVRYKGEKKKRLEFLRTHCSQIDFTNHYRDQLETRKEGLLKKWQETLDKYSVELFSPNLPWVETILLQQPVLQHLVSAKEKLQDEISPFPPVISKNFICSWFFEEDFLAKVQKAHFLNQVQKIDISCFHILFVKDSTLAYDLEELHMGSIIASQELTPEPDKKAKDVEKSIIDKKKKIAPDKLIEMLNGRLR